MSDNEAPGFVAEGTEFSQISALTHLDGLDEDDLDDGEEPLTEWEKNPSYRTQRNSPGRKATKSPVWNSVKHLADDHPLANQYTHVCVLPDCPTSRFMVLRKPSGKGYYTTTKAIRHIQMHHSDATENKVNLARSNVLHVSCTTKRRDMYCLFCRLVRLHYFF